MAANAQGKFWEMHDKLYEKILDSLASSPTPAAAPSGGGGGAAPQHYDIEPGDGPAKGPKNAPVTLLEFSDFQ